MNRECYEILYTMSLPNVILITLEDLERGDEALIKAKQNRTLIEYYFTCTPSLPLFILKNTPEVEMVTYLDADLFFFTDPAPLFKEIADQSIAIIEHRFPPHYHHLDQYGIYNVGWISIRRDEHAFTCLRWWRNECIKWCYDRPEDGRFADQKYLDNWPSRFKGVVVLQYKGANVAPWNLANYKIHKNGNSLWVDDQPLIFFHFHGLKQINDWLYDTGLTDYKVKPSQTVKRGIYVPYIRTLIDKKRQVLSLLPETSFKRCIRYQERDDELLRRVMKNSRKLIHICLKFFTKSYIFVMNRTVL
jgi:hypothetical protein